MSVTTDFDERVEVLFIAEIAVETNYSRVIEESLDFELSYKLAQEVLPNHKLLFDDFHSQNELCFDLAD